MKKKLAFSYLESIACLLVLFWHVITFNSGAVPFVKEIGNHLSYIPYDTVVTLVLAKYVNIGQLGVGFFFLVSGFLITRSRLNSTMLSFIFKRLWRILPISIVSVILCYFGVEFINNLYFDSSISLGIDKFFLIFLNGFLLNDLFFLPPIIPVFWFLLVLIKFYFIALFIKKFSQKDFIILALLLLLIVFSYVVFSSRLEVDYPLIFGWLRLLAFNAHHILFILIGCSLYFIFNEFVFENSCKILYGNLRYPVFLYFFFIVSFTALETTPLKLPIDMLKNYSISLFIFIVVLFFSNSINVKIRPLLFISSINYSLYTLHFTFGCFYVFLLSRFTFMRDNLFLLFILVFLFVIVTAYFVEVVVNKICYILRRCLSKS